MRLHLCRLHLSLSSPLPLLQLQLLPRRPFPPFTFQTFSTPSHAHSSLLSPEWLPLHLLLQLVLLLTLLLSWISIERKRKEREEEKERAETCYKKGYGDKEEEKGGGYEEDHGDKEEKLREKAWKETLSLVRKEKSQRR